MGDNSAKFLYVFEDEKSLQCLYEIVARRMGVPCKIFPTPAPLSQLEEAAGVITDGTMKDPHTSKVFDGGQFAAEARAYGYKGPIVMITALPDDYQNHKTTKVIDDLIAKPAALDTIREAINKIISGQYRNL